MCFGCSKELSLLNTFFEYLKHNFTIGGKQPTPRFACLKDPLIETVLFNTQIVSNKRKITSPKKHTKSGHQRPASNTLSQWQITGRPLMALRCVLAGWRPYDSRAIKRDNISSVNMVRQFTINLYFHCCYQCCYMYIYVNRGCHLIDRISFLFYVLGPAKHKRRGSHNLQGAHFFNALTDVPITSLKT